MRIINTSVCAFQNKVLVIGFEGENERTQVRIDASEVFTEYPHATPSLTVKPNSGEAYPAPVNRDGTDVVWDITSSYLTERGESEIQLTFIKDSVVCKSYIGKALVLRSLTVEGEMPTPVESWVDAANAKLAEVDAQIVELEGMVDTATDAATRAEQSASTASTKAEQAAGSAATATEKATEATNAAGTATAKAAEAALSATQARNSAVSAADSERIATAKAVEATTAAGTATTKAEQATEAAQTAIEKAGEASASATAAQASATDAASSATAASASETAAKASETAAGASATQAAQSVLDAGANAQTAMQKAAEAATSATNAAASATNAATSAETASTKAGEAAQSAQAVEETAEQLAESLEQIGQNTADIAEHEQEYNALKEATLIHNTASGSIASFVDGAEMPVDEVTAQINPVQDLHGYDHPWPAGGGVNKFDEQVSLGLLNSDGSISQTNGRLVTGFIPVEAGKEYAFVWPTNFGRGRGAFYDSSKNLVQYFSDFPSDTSHVGSGYGLVTAPTGAAFLRINLTSSYGTTYNHDISVNYPSSVTTYTPYSNICPITGFEGLTVTRAGKNLLDDSIKAVFGSRLLIGATSIYNNPTYLKAGTYSITVFGVNQTFAYLMKSQYALKTIVNGTNHGSFTVDNDGYYRIDFYGNDAISGNVTGVILVPGSTYATAYEPYTDQTYHITFPSEAGTVYGGELDVTTGVLTVDRVSQTLTKSSAWYSFSSGTGSASAVVNMAYAPKYVQGIANYNGGMSSTGPEFPNYWTSQRPNEAPPSGFGFAYISSGYVRFTTADAANNTTIKAFKENFPDTQLVYKLATPLTYTLTASEITTLLGQNNFWHDANGDISVGYKANTKLYIDGKIAELVARIVNS